MRQTQDILIVDYNGPQGSKELEFCESADINRSKSFLEELGGRGVSLVEE